MSKGVLPATPYKGLVPYSEEDAPFFFGREPEREIITDNLMGSRLTLLYGASGVGKSSVLRAGVAHRLGKLARQNLAKRGAAEVAVVVFSAWRDNPLGELTAQIQHSVARTLGEPAESGSTYGNFPDVLESAIERINGRLLIILDQFEEYFLYHAQEDGQGSFASEFPWAVNNPDLPVSFMISIREDALAKLDRFEGRIPNLFDNYLRVEHLDRDSAREAIIKPIDQYNRLTDPGRKMIIEPALVEEVLKQVRTGQVVLGETGRGSIEGKDTEAQIETPYLQLVMTRLWNEELREGSRVLRLDTLKNLGGAEWIVKTHLDEAMSGLRGESQDVAAHIFRYLVTPSGTKIALSEGDLAELGELRQEQLAPVIEELSSGDIRILRPVAPPPDNPGPPRYEIFHDVLAPAILDWRSRYAQVQELAGAESQLALEVEELSRLEKRERERKLVRLQRRWLMTLVLLLLIIIGAMVFAFLQKAEADNQQKIARSRELAAHAISQLRIDPELSLILATEAVRVKQTAQSEEALRQSLLELPTYTVMLGHMNSVNSAAFSPDGKLIVTGGGDGTARVWDASTGQSLIEMRGHTNSLRSAAFSPDGKLIVTASIDNTARVWDASTGQSLRELRGHKYGVNSAAFSPDGKRIVTASNDDTARVWDASTSQSLKELRGHTDSLRSAAFSPDGKLIVTASFDRTARVWSASTGKSLRELRGHTSLVTSAAFSPDGKLIVTASFDRTARMWDASTGQSLKELREHTGNVTSAAFSPDGKRIVTASWDGTVRVWDASTGQSLRELQGNTRAVNSASFSPDGKLIVIASYDGTARVWDTSTGQGLRELQGHMNTVNSASFSPDGQLVVTAGRDGTARVWDANTGQSLRELQGHRDNVESAAFSPDGKRIVTASWDGTARVWDTGTGQSLIELRGHKASLNSAEFSPDGKLIVTASSDGTARVWDASTGQSLRELQGRTRAVNSASFSPDGKLIITASSDDTVRVWDAGTGQSLRELQGRTRAVNSTSFSPDGKLIVTAGSDFTARVWDASTGQILRELQGHTSPVMSAEFSPDGRLIVTASNDGTARVWDANTGQSFSGLQGNTSYVTSASFSPDGNLIVTASNEGTSRIYPYESFAPFEELQTLARARIVRALTEEEKRKYGLEQ